MYSHMLKLGWCRSIAAAFAAKNLDIQCFAASISPPEIKKDHSLCSERICLGNQVSEETYDVKHASEDCECQFLSPKIESLISIIRNGQKPLILLPTDAVSYEAVGSLDVITGEPGVSYVAISHVWKDGLGNPHKNALPVCQILRLSGLVHSVYAARNNTSGGMSRQLSAEVSWISDSGSLIPIWIDTLCVPVGHKYKEERNVAISNMREVYQEADAVLVIDAELQRVPLNAMSWKRPVVDRIGMLFRFSTCAWNSRLWTFEEGRLGNDAYLLLEDGIIRARDLFYRSSIEMCLLHDIAREALSLLDSLVNARFADGPQEIILGRILLGLAYRQTSRSGDETICVSHMLKTDTAELLKVDPEMRMRTFLDTLENIPPGLLFMGEPRLSEKGYRWAPTSFLHRQARFYENQRLLILPRHPLPGRPAAQIMDDGSGLKIMSPGIRLGLFDDLPEESEFRISNRGLTARYDRDPAIELLTWVDVRAQYSDRTAAFIIPCHAADPSYPVDCVLVAIESKQYEDDLIHCNVACSSQLHKTRADLKKPASENDSSVSVKGTILPYPQTWIVD